MIFARKDALSGLPFLLWFRAGGDNIRLRRVSGGIGWPGRGRPGFVVALGEELEENQDWPGVRNLHVLHEQQDWQGQNFLSVPAMIRAVGEIQRRFLVREWWCEPRPDFSGDLRAYNREQTARRLPVVRLWDVPSTVSPEWLAMRVHLRTSGQKTMFFRGADLTRAALSGLARDLSGLSWGDSPEVTALLMAVSGLDAREFRSGRVEDWRPADSLAGY